MIDKHLAISPVTPECSAELPNIGWRLHPTRRLHIEFTELLQLSVLLPKPSAADVSCVVEVAGTSLERDRTTKLRHYARGGIPQYLIVNLGERTVEEYVGPEVVHGTYVRSVTHSVGDSVDLHLGGAERLAVTVRELLPPGGGQL